MWPKEDEILTKPQRMFLLNHGCWDCRWLERSQLSNTEGMCTELGEVTDTDLTLEETDCHMWVKEES